MSADLLGVAPAGDVVAAVDDLTQSIVDQAPVIERDRELPAGLIDDLVRAGCFRLLLPARHGGFGADLATAIDVWRRLARADASVAWTAMIGGAAWCDLAGLPRASFDELFPHDGDVIVAGAFSPTGSITLHADGYAVSGRWGFASGCRHATVLYGNCVDAGSDSAMPLRIAVFEPADVVIEDTWSTLGLRGTGSHHFHVENVIVPAERTLDPIGDEANVDTPIVRIPVPTLASLALAGVALGIAQGAVSDIVSIADGKVPLLAAAPLATDPTFQNQLATVDTGVRAAHALLNETIGATWATAVEARPLTPGLRADVRSAANWIVDRAVAAVDASHRAAGSASVYTGSPLERRLRDIHTLTQHFLVRADATTVAGSVLAGRPLEAMVF